MPRFVLVKRGGLWRLSAVRDGVSTPLGVFRSRGQACEKIAQMQIAYMFPSWVLEPLPLSPLERGLGFSPWQLVEVDGPDVQTFQAPSHALAFLRERQFAQEVRADLARARAAGDFS